MRWYTWILAPLLTAFFGMFAAGTLAALLVEWYRISSFEGGSGFFVIGIALVGWIAGLIVGLIAAIVASRRPQPGFLKAVGYGWGASLAIVLVIGGVSRFLADIPPEIRGETLYLQVELRYPAGSPRPTYVDGGYTRLHSASMSVVRKSEDGPLWLEDAREEDGRWIIPGAVHVFTQRGRRLLDIGIGDKPLAGFDVPLPGHPREEHERWSDWLPRYESGREPAGGGFTYRFRVVRYTEPVRTMTIGPFEVGVMASDFYRTSGTEDMAARSTFRLSHGGRLIEGLGTVDYLAVVNGPEPVLFVRSIGIDGTSTCRFVVGAGAGAELVDLGRCVQSEEIAPLTNDAGLFARARVRRPLPGWPDRLTFQLPGLYQVADLLVDTRTRTGRHFERPTDPYPVSGVPPLGLSPDERSIVLLSRDANSKTSLTVADTIDGGSYTLPIDPVRMRFNSDDVIDPAWVQHHFEWAKGPSGHDMLRERPSFEVLPYRGEFQDEAEAPSYSIGPGKEPLRDAIITILTAEMGAEALPDGNYGFNKRVRISGKVIEVTVIESGPYIYVSYEGSGGDVALMRSIAARLDAALATRKWDEAFR